MRDDGFGKYQKHGVYMEGERTRDRETIGKGSYSYLPGLWMRADGTLAQVSCKTENGHKASCDGPWGDMRSYCPCTVAIQT